MLYQVKQKGSFSVQKISSVPANIIFKCRKKNEAKRLMGRASDGEVAGTHRQCT